MDVTEPTGDLLSALPRGSGEQRLRRDNVLAKCIEAGATWTVSPGRNLVLLFDGTGNIIGNHEDTNVVHLLRALDKHASDDAVRPAQIVYYDPGVGTANQFPASSIGAKIGHMSRKLAGLAMGSGAFDNIAEAYEFLVNNYRIGDRIFLFGFSRGAFTARAVGGMVNMYGLVHTAGLSLTKMLVNNYFSPKRLERGSGDKRQDFASDIVKNFSLGRTPLIHFTGVWDTVETIGSGLMGGLTITNDSDLVAKNFVHVRHALALHETRCKYRPRRYMAPDFSREELRHRSFDERWFRGVHSDVGGSYSRDGLARISLKWMAEEAFGAGLLVDPAAFDGGNNAEPIHDQSYESPYWIWTGLSSRRREASDLIHASALPVSGAREAECAPRSNRLFQIWGWLLTLLVIGIGWNTARMQMEACTFSHLPSMLASLPTSIQLLAPWQTPLSTYCSPTAITRALRWDWYFLATYFLWLPYPMTWALRRLAARAIPAGAELSKLQRNVQWVMLALVGADAVENLATYWLEYVAWLVAAAEFVKWIAVLALASVLVAGMMAATSRIAPQLGARINQ